MCMRVVASFHLVVENCWGVWSVFGLCGGGLALCFYSIFFHILPLSTDND